MSRPPLPANTDENGVYEAAVAFRAQQARIAHDRHQTDAHDTIVAGLSRKLTLMRDARDAALQANSSLRAEVNRLQAELAAVTPERNTLQRQVATLQEANANLKCKCANLK